MKRTFTCLIIFLGLANSHLVAQSNEPCGATVLTVNLTCTGATGIAGTINPTAYTNSTSASAGVTLPALSCNGFTTTTRDFWFTAVVPASGSLVVTVEAGSNPTITPSDFWDMALYSSSSATCAGSTFSLLTSSCVASEAPSLKVTGQTAGSTVYVRVWREAAFTQTAARSYFISAFDGNIPTPACPTYVNPVSGATGFTGLDFVWTQAADATAYDFYLGNSAGSALNLGTFDKSIYANDTLNIPYGNVSGSTVDYFIPPGAASVWYVAPRNCISVATGCASGARTFTAASAPLNENCSGAFTFTSGTIFFSPSAFSTQSQAAGACPTDYAADVWFKFTTNAVGGSATIDAASDGFTDVGIEVFSGTCGSLTPIGCVDDFSDDEQLVLTSLAPNTTYYMRLYTYISTASTLLWGDGYFFILTGAAVLPVELTKFEGKAKGTTNVLTWQTATERDASHFVIERSVNGNDEFKSVGTVKAAGNSTTLKDYTFYDQEPLSNGYYRLKTVDLDGKEGLSKTISIKRNGQKLTLVKVFPTPASDVLTIGLESQTSETLNLTITDLLGRVVEQKKVENTEGYNQISINVAQLPIGTYFIQLVAGGQQVKGKFIKN